MKINPTLKCSLCPQDAPGTLIHMVWECPEVSQFWRLVSNMFQYVPLFSSQFAHRRLYSSMIHPNWIFAGKAIMVACQWKPPHSRSKHEMFLYFIDLAQLELSVAQKALTFTIGVLWGLR